MCLPWFQFYSYVQSKLFFSKSPFIILFWICDIVVILGPFFSECSDDMEKKKDDRLSLLTHSVAAS